MTHETSSASEREQLFRADHDLRHQTAETYYRRKATALQSGVPTWIVRNFGADTYVYGLWHEQTEVALVDDEGNGYFRIYVRDVDSGDTFLDDTLSLMEAVTRAERYWGIATI